MERPTHDGQCGRHPQSQGAAVPPPMDGEAVAIAVGGRAFVPPSSERSSGSRMLEVQPAPPYISAPAFGTSPHSADHGQQLLDYHPSHHPQPSPVSISPLEHAAFTTPFMAPSEGLLEVVQSLIRQADEQLRQEALEMEATSAVARSQQSTTQHSSRASMPNPNSLLPSVGQCPQPFPPQPFHATCPRAAANRQPRGNPHAQPPASPAAERVTVPAQHQPQARSAHPTRAAPQCATSDSTRQRPSSTIAATKSAARSEPHSVRSTAPQACDRSAGAPSADRSTTGSSSGATVPEAASADAGKPRGSGRAPGSGSLATGDKTPSSGAGPTARKEIENGSRYNVGHWYEGVVKRYNSARGFGFVTGLCEILTPTSAVAVSGVPLDESPPTPSDNAGALQPKRSGSAPTPGALKPVTHGVFRSVSSGDAAAAAGDVEAASIAQSPAAPLGDIFIHHTCITMEGFRHLVVGATVRFRVAVLMGTVQAIDLVVVGAQSSPPPAADGAAPAVPPGFRHDSSQTTGTTYSMDAITTPHPQSTSPSTTLVDIGSLESMSKEPLSSESEETKDEGCAAKEATSGNGSREREWRTSDATAAAGGPALEKRSRHVDIGDAPAFPLPQEPLGSESPVDSMTSPQRLFGSPTGGFGRWDAVFAQKMARERVKDREMRKDTLSFFPHDSAGSAVAAAAVMNSGQRRVYAETAGTHPGEHHSEGQRQQPGKESDRRAALTELLTSNSSSDSAQRCSPQGPGDMPSTSSAPTRAAPPSGAWPAYPSPDAVPSVASPVYGERFQCFSLVPVNVLPAALAAQVPSDRAFVAVPQTMMTALGVVEVRDPPPQTDPVRLPTPPWLRGRNGSGTDDSSGSHTDSSDVRGKYFVLDGNNGRFSPSSSDCPPSQQSGYRHHHPGGYGGMGSVNALSSSSHVSGSGSTENHYGPPIIVFDAERRITIATPGRVTVKQHSADWRRHQSGSSNGESRTTNTSSQAVARVESPITVEAVPHTPVSVSGGTTPSTLQCSVAFPATAPAFTAYGFPGPKPEPQQGVADMEDPVVRHGGAVPQGLHKPSTHPRWVPSMAFSPGAGSSTSTTSSPDDIKPEHQFL